MMRSGWMTAVRRWLDAQGARLGRRLQAARWYRGVEELEPLRAGRGGSEWVLARSYCVYVTVGCAAVPAARRRDYVAVAVRRAAPFADADWYAAWRGETAQVWLWSRSAVRGARVEGVAASRIRMLPESVLRGAVQAQGAQLLADREGCEGRLWRDGVLVASVWWPAVPEATVWAGFCRGAGLAVTAVPALQPAQALAERAWTQASRAGGLETLRLYRRELVLGAVAVWMLALGFELGALVRTRWALHGVERALASERAAISDILAARGEAEQARVAIERLQALQAVPSQLALLQAVSARIPGAGWRLLEWHMTDPQHLEMTLSMPQADPPGLVRSLEGSDFLRAVRAEIGPAAPDQLVVRATVQVPAAGIAEPGFAGPPARPAATGVGSAAAVPPAPVTGVAAGPTVVPAVAYRVPVAPVPAPARAAPVFQSPPAPAGGNNQGNGNGQGNGQGNGHNGNGQGGGA